MIEAVCTSETSMYLNETTQTYIPIHHPEDGGNTHLWNIDIFQRGGVSEIVRLMLTVRCQSHFLGS
jgi:hypothetical protein